MNRKVVSVVFLCMHLAVLCACADQVTDEKQKNDSLDVKTQAQENNSQSDGKLHRNTENTSSDVDTEDAKGDDQMEGEQQEDAFLEEELSRYRQEREEYIDEMNYGMPADEDYTFTEELNRIMLGVVHHQLDTKEWGEAYEAAKAYVVDVRMIQPTTKAAVYNCVDPRMAAIYEDDDKGAAAGYENDNIILYEYCGEDGIWQYLIVARDEKEAPWKVIHNGRSYKD